MEIRNNIKTNCLPQTYLPKTPTSKYKEKTQHVMEWHPEKKKNITSLKPNAHTYAWTLRIEPRSYWGKVWGLPLHHTLLAAFLLKKTEKQPWLLCQVFQT